MDIIETVDVAGETSSGFFSGLFSNKVFWYGVGTGVAAAGITGAIIHRSRVKAMEDKLAARVTVREDTVTVTSQKTAEAAEPVVEK